MPAKVTNFGPARSFATSVGNVFLGNRQTRTIESERAAEELRRYPHLRVAVMQPPAPPKATERKPDLTKYPINTLRHMAKARGVQGFFTMKKAALLAALEA